jgi:hypothetical protein
MKKKELLSASSAILPQNVFDEKPYSPGVYTLSNLPGRGGTDTYQYPPNHSDQKYMLKIMCQQY